MTLPTQKFALSIIFRQADREKLFKEILARSLKSHRWRMQSAIVILFVGGLINILTNGEIWYLVVGIVALAEFFSFFLTLDLKAVARRQLRKFQAEPDVRISLVIGLGGLARARDEISEFFAWEGLSQVDVMPGGLGFFRDDAICGAQLTAFIPDHAFADETQRKECFAFCRDMIARSKAVARTGRSRPSKLSRVFSLSAWYLVLQLWWLGILFSLIVWWPWK